MANCLIRHRGGVLALLACLPWPALAQSALADPTRPPVGVSVPVDEKAALPELVLQSVIIPEAGKPSALIGGRQVRLGERYGTSRLTRLSEREAVLVGPDGTVLLRLTPAVEKTYAAKPSKTPAPRPAQGGRKQ